jgi:hypothetical protein
MIIPVEFYGVLCINIRAGDHVFLISLLVLLSERTVVTGMLPLFRYSCPVESFKTLETPRA